MLVPSVLEKDSKNGKEYLSRSFYFVKNISRQEKSRQLVKVSESEEQPLLNT